LNRIAVPPVLREPICSAQRSFTRRFLPTGAMTVRSTSRIAQIDWRVAILVFFDPDMGLEVSKPRRRKLSCQYLYWDELQATFDAGSSVLIYQHFPRQKRDEYIPGIAQQLKALLSG